MLYGLVISNVVFFINLREGPPAEAGGSGVVQLCLSLLLGGYLPAAVKRAARIRNPVLAYGCGGPLAAITMSIIVGSVHTLYGSPEVLGTTVFTGCLVLCGSSFLVWFTRTGETAPTRLHVLDRWL